MVITIRLTTCGARKKVRLLKDYWHSEQNCRSGPPRVSNLTKNSGSVRPQTSYNARNVSHVSTESSCAACTVKESDGVRGVALVPKEKEIHSIVTLVCLLSYIVESVPYTGFSMIRISFLEVFTSKEFVMGVWYIWAFRVWNGLVKTTRVELWVLVHFSSSILRYCEMGLQIKWLLPQCDSGLFKGKYPYFFKARQVKAKTHIFSFDKLINLTPKREGLSTSFVNILRLQPPRLGTRWSRNPASNNKYVWISMQENTGEREHQTLMIYILCTTIGGKFHY